MKYEVKKFYRQNKRNCDSAGLLVGAIAIYKITGFMVIPGFIIAGAIALWRKK